MKLICPSCGVSNEEVRFLGPFCIRCKPVHIECPKRAEYQRCSRCGRKSGCTTTYFTSRSPRYNAVWWL